VLARAQSTSTARAVASVPENVASTPTCRGRRDPSAAENLRMRRSSSVGQGVTLASQTARPWFHGAARCWAESTSEDGSPAGGCERRTNRLRRHWVMEADVRTSIRDELRLIAGRCRVCVIARVPVPSRLARAPVRTALTTPSRGAADARALRLVQNSTPSSLPDGS